MCSNTSIMLVIVWVRKRKRNYHWILF